MQPIVLGAAGFIGLNLVDALLEAGVVPRCGRRRRTNVLVLRKRKAPMVRADLDEPDELVAAMEGCDTVFHCAGHYPRLSTDPEGSRALALRQTRNALDAAARAGVTRFVYVSSTATVAPNPDGPSTEAHVFASDPGLGTYHSVKWALEALVGAEDRYEVRTACPGACIGPWDLRVGTSAIVVATARGMDPPHPDGWVNPVDVRDVGTALVRYGQLDSAPARLLLASRDLRLHDLLTSLAERYGVATPSAPLSADEARAYADAAEREAEATGQRAAMSREIVDLVNAGVPLDTSLAARLLDIRWRSLDDTLDAYDAWARRLKILPPLEPQEASP